MADDHKQHADRTPTDAQTITPVTPPLGRDGRKRRRSRRPDTLRSMLILSAGVALLAAAYAVFVWLPAQMTPPPSPPPATVMTDEPAEPPAPDLSDEELAQLRAQTERLLSQLLRQQSRVLQRQPEGWAGDEWVRYQRLSREGDDAYLADRYWESVPAYRSALELGETLLQEADTRVGEALAAGRAALEAGDHVTATREFETVIAIDRSHSEAERGLARAAGLPEVLQHTERADELRAAGRLQEAADAYRDALRVDAAWAPARDALADVNARIGRARFEAVMSQGLTALADEDFTAATTHFENALAMRPDSPEARDGLMQAEHGLTLDRIALAEARALAFERRELWNDAIAQYHAALATDSALTFAREGLARAEPRADLDVKIVHIIDNPSLLLTDAVLNDAVALLEQARALDSPAGRLAAQVEELDRIITIASTPIPVELVSDQNTEVTLYRIGPLGRFDRTTVALRPGTYTVVGSRNGYRDVRRTFTVLPGRTVEPVTVACVEPI